MAMAIFGASDGQWAQVTVPVFITLLLLAGLLKCAKIARRETTSAVCVASLGLALFAWMVGVWITPARSLIADERLGLLVALLAALVFVVVVLGAFVTGIVGLILYSNRAEYLNQGRKQAGWGIALSTVMLGLFGVGVAYGVARAIENRHNVPQHLRAQSAPSAGQPYRFEAENFELDNPGPAWVSLDPARANDDAAVVLMRARPQQLFMVIAEEFGFEHEYTSEDLVAVAQANQTSVAPRATFTDHEPMTLNGVPGLRFGAVTPRQKKTHAYEYWVASHNGYLFQVIFWMEGDNAGEARQAAEEVRRGFRLIDPARVVHAEGFEPLGLIEEPALGYAWDLADTPWVGWPDLSEDFPEARTGAQLGEQACAAVVSIPLNGLSPPINDLALLLLERMDFEPHETTLAQATPLTQGAGNGLRFTAERRFSGDKPYEYVMRVLQTPGAAYLMVGWTFADQDRLPAVEDALRRVQINGRVSEDAVATLNDLQQAQRADMLNDLGIFAYNDRRYEAAAALFAEACRSGEDPVFLINWALTLEDDLNRPADAMAALDEHGPRFPDHFEVNTLRAKVLASTGQTDAALDTYAQAFADGHDDTDDLEAYLDLLIEAGRADEAMELAQAFEKKHPSESASLARVRVLRGQEAYAEAAEALRAMQQDRPFSASIHYELAEVYLWDDEYGRCADAARRLIAAGYDSAYANYLLGRGLLGVGRHPEAKAAFEKAVNQDPTDEVYRDYLDYVAGELGQGDNRLIKEPIEPVPVPDLVMQRVNAVEARPWTAPEGYGAAVLRRIDAIDYAPDKPFKHTRYRRIAIHDQRAVDRYTTLEFDFDPLSDRVYVNHARVLDAQGKVVGEAGLDAMYVTDDGDDGMATQDKTLHVPVPGLAPGTVLEFAWTVEGLGDEGAMPLTEWLFSTSTPTRAAAIAVTGDVDRLAAIPLGDVEPLTDPDAPDVRAWMMVEPPTYRWEPLRPALRDYLPTVILGDARADWAELGRSYLDDIAEPLNDEDDDATAAIAARVTAELNSDDDKVRALAEYVRDTLTYKAIEFGRRAWTPNPAAKTLALKYGDCKDHALLLHRLLDEAGVDSALALIDTGQAVVESLPSMDQFDHMIVYVPGGHGGAGTFIDTTDKASPAVLPTPLGLGDKWALVLDASPRLVKTPPYADDQTLTITRDIALLPDGSADVTDRIAFVGRFAYDWRGWLRNRDADRRRDAVADQLQPYGVSRLTGFGLEGLDDPDQPLVIETRYRLPDALHAEGDRLTGRLPSPWALYYIDTAPVDDRRAPFKLTRTWTLTADWTITPPPGMQLVGFDRRAARGETPFNTWSAEPGGPPTAPRLEYGFTRRAGRFPADQYPAFEAAMADAIAPLRAPLTVELIR